MTDKATICCPGPSLRKQAFDQRLEGGLLVAVTDAIFLPLPWTAWAFLEHPRKMNGDRYRLYAQRLWECTPIEVWCHRKENVLAQWAAWEISGLKLVPQPAWKDLWQQQPFKMAIQKPANNLPMSTPFHAILCCLRKGAKHIRVIGADMQGHANVHPVTGADMENRFAPQAWEHRWREERKLFQAMQEECEKNGVLLERV